MPPRTANWPTSSTIGTRSKPRASSASISARKPEESPRLIVSRRSARRRGRGARSCRARGVVTRRRARPPSNASMASTRSPPISRWGSPVSKGSASRWGYITEAPSPSSTSRSASMLIATRGSGAMTTKIRSSRNSCRVPTSAEPAEPTAPVTVSRSSRSGSESAASVHARRVAKADRIRFMSGFPSGVAVGGHQALNHEQQQ